MPITLSRQASLFSLPAFPSHDEDAASLKSRGGPPRRASDALPCVRTPRPDVMLKSSSASSLRTIGTIGTIGSTKPIGPVKSGMGNVATATHEARSQAQDPSRHSIQFPAPGSFVPVDPADSALHQAIQSEPRSIPSAAGSRRGSNASNQSDCARSITISVDLPMPSLSGASGFDIMVREAGNMPPSPDAGFRRPGSRHSSDGISATSVPDLDIFRSVSPHLPIASTKTTRQAIESALRRFFCLDGRAAD